MRNKFVDGNASARQFGNALRETEMELTNGVGIGKRGRREWARVKNDLDAIISSANRRVKTLTFHHIDDECDGIVFRTCAETLATSSPAPYLHRRVSGSDDLSKQQTETFVWSRDAPPAIRGGMDAVVEPRPAGTATGRKFLGQEFGVDQLREVLSDRIVIEAEVLRELGDVNGCARIGHVAEDPVAGRIPERSCLFLECCHPDPSRSGPRSVRV